MKILKMIRDNPKKFHLRRFFLANRLKKVNSDPAGYNKGWYFEIQAVIFEGYSKLGNKENHHKKKERQYLDELMTAVVDEPPDLLGTKLPPSGRHTAEHCTRRKTK